MTMETRPRLFVVEDHDIVRFGVERLLETRFRLVGSADEVVTAVELIRERTPDLVLLDVAIPGGGGAMVVEAVRRTHPHIKFLAFTVSTSRHDVLRLIRAGVNGYVVKSTDRHELLDLVEQVLGGGLPISPEVAGYLLDIDDERVVGSGFTLLTTREREVATYIARGFTYREVADTLGISIKTLETHLHHIFAKLGVHSRHELSKVAYQTGFLNAQEITAGPPSGTVTFLVTRLADADRLWNEESELMPTLLARHDASFGRAIEECGGWVVRSTGDGLVAAFPIASSAVDVALQTQARAAEEKTDRRLSVKVVVVTAETEAHNGEYSGTMLDTAAAILDRCGPGEVVTTAVTKSLAAATGVGQTWEWRRRSDLEKSAKSREPFYEVSRTNP